MAETPQLPPFDEIANALIEIGSWQLPAEMHGWFAGYLAVGGTLHRDEALAAIASYLGCTAPGPGQSQILFQLYEVTRSQYLAGSMDLEILAPEDGADLFTRSESLVAWCRGFLSGFAEGGKRRQQSGEKPQYGEDVSEALSNIASIADMDTEAPESEESDSHMFAVSEYVRMAAISLFLDCADPEAVNAPPERLH